MVGSIPIIPTTAVKTRSALSYVATKISPSILLKTSQSKSFIFSLNSFAKFSSNTLTISGLNSLICFSNNSILLPQLMLTTFISLLSLTISSA